MEGIPWKEVFQMGFAAVMALALLYILVKEVREMRVAYFESTEKITKSVESGAEKTSGAITELTEVLKYAHNIAPKGMTPRGGDTPTPGELPAVGRRP